MNIKELERLLRKAWSRETCYPKVQNEWSPENPSRGQCKVTALIVQDYFGGDIWYSETLNHFWNVLPDGAVLDLTKEQFGEEYDISDGVNSGILITDRSTETLDEDIFDRYTILKNKLL